jgi:UDP-N-acetylmuramyl tripeptide synthase
MALPYLIDSRRLTGASMLLERPGAIIETRLPNAIKAQLLELWPKLLRVRLRALGMAHEQSVVRDQGPTQMLAITAPIDALLPATYILERVYADALRACGIEQHSEEVLSDEQLEARLVRRSHPRHVALLRSAKRHGVLCQFDEDSLSLGMGAEVENFELDELPLPDAIDWPALKTRVPIALITGTNGKTTTARLLARMLKCAGHVVGFCCTDYVQIGDQITDRDDYSGPTGARKVLRHPEVTAAVLETARGGMLRRGLQVSDADVAVLTNVADDHLGDGGIHTLKQLAECKFTITRGLRRAAPVVVNADNRPCAAHAKTLDRAIIWFAKQRPRTPSRARAWVYLREQTICIESLGAVHELVPVAEVPMTLGGHAKHNIENALAAVAAAHALKLPLEAMRAGLKEFGLSPDDNPGRLNRFSIAGGTVLVDYGHNPEGLRAVFDALTGIPHQRLLVAFGQAGDRTDADIRGLADAVAKAGADRVLIKELPKMLRGRALGEIPALIRTRLAKHGVREVHQVADDHAAVDDALAWLQPGDLAVLFLHVDKEELLARLKAL